MCERVLRRQRDDERCYTSESRLNGVCGCVWKRNCMRLWMRLSKRRLQGWMKKKKRTAQEHLFVGINTRGACITAECVVVSAENSQSSCIYIVYITHAGFLSTASSAEMTGSRLQMSFKEEWEQIERQFSSTFWSFCRRCCCCWAAATTRILSHDCRPDTSQSKLNVAEGQRMLYPEEFSFLINIENRKDGIHVREMFQYEYILYQRENKGTPSRQALKSNSWSAGCVSFLSSQVATKKSSGNEHGKLMVFSWDRDSRAWVTGFLSSFQ